MPPPAHACSRLYRLPSGGLRQWEGQSHVPTGCWMDGTEWMQRQLNPIFSILSMVLHVPQTDLYLFTCCPWTQKGTRVSFPHISIHPSTLCFLMVITGSSDTRIPITHHCRSCAQKAALLGPGVWFFGLNSTLFRWLCHCLPFGLVDLFFSQLYKFHKVKWFLFFVLKILFI